ncbi:transposase, IS605 OrfB family [Stanieria cyanosphaera PCC 7437]|uniref:Transposase, IS605 OrfB family n=1 Tax=Stanieria cyanosphaera (strain ATCC 29371 / PCC 7437) TaxID=111780 RepID=K9XTA3_STAC7|nr:RNA-guided endonuclease TnpB family protein [Stanieria cyanosphaera]AFZ35835.1 transposase, IS605 OrfB family [Stanieria cyanosphaera PCC 7437]
MRQVEKHVIKKSNQWWQEIDDLAFKSKNLFNLANYEYRQYYFAEGKTMGLPSLYHKVKNADAYRALPTKVSKQIIKNLTEVWTGYVNAHNDWEKNPHKYLGEPRIPKYKDKTKGRNLVIYPDESIYKKTLKDGICHLSMSNIKIQTQVKVIDQVRIVPTNSAYVVEIIYEKPELEQSQSSDLAGIDLGISNLIALTSNQPGFTPLLINGRKLKSINQFFNKRKAQLQSQLKGNQKTSKRLKGLTDKRNRVVDNFIHVTSRLVVDILKACEIGILVIGKNDGWKHNVAIGKKNNQQFVQIPHAKLIEKITYKAQLEGIKVITINESYTSKTSALDLEQPVKQTTYKGKRVKRGLFKTASGIVWNADINGSCQIVRKYAPDAFKQEELVRLAVNPLLVNPV